MYSQPNIFCYISPVHSDLKFEISVQLVGLVFGSLLCTTEAHNAEANLSLFLLLFSSVQVCCRGEDQS